MDRLVQHQILLKLGGSSPLHCDRVVARQVQFLFPFQRKYCFFICMPFQVLALTNLGVIVCIASGG